MREAKLCVEMVLATIDDFKVAKMSFVSISLMIVGERSNGGLVMRGEGFRWRPSKEVDYKLNVMLLNLGL